MSNTTLMSKSGWAKRLRHWRGGGSIEDDLTLYQPILTTINQSGESLAAATDDKLCTQAAELKARARQGATPDELLIETFALAREIAHRLLNMRPFDVQVLAALALHRGKLVELQTGEGKTLAAVLPACLNALSGCGVHVLTFNDYLARRDAAWMGPVYEFFGLRVAVIQEGMSNAERRAAYAADVTYATAKEAGFDFLRMHLCRTPEELAHRPFHFAIVDEADSLLIDEARVPLVIAGESPASETSPYRLAEVVRALQAEQDWETDDNKRNVSLTERGVERLETALQCSDLHSEANGLLLTEIQQALHAFVLVRRDVDYIVRDGRLELVDEFTGRVVANRRWPDGLQVALEAKEALPIQPGGRLYGSITLQHFLAHYPKLSGMTATAQPAAEELELFYKLKVVPIPPNRPCQRIDDPDLIFTHKEAKYQALLAEILHAHQTGRPVLVGTQSVEESELLAARLAAANIPCQVLNAKNDEAEAAIIARAGAVGAVTISTNMAGRGTDIRLGGPHEEDRARVVAAGGLYVIGTNRNESRRIDDQLRGRAGRQGDPGTSRFFVSLEDTLLVRFGIERLIPPKFMPAPQATPLEHAAIRAEVERVQRIVEGQNFEIRKTLWHYSHLVEEQRRTLQDWRMNMLTGTAELQLCATHLPARYAELLTHVSPATLQEAERQITLHHLDQAWAEHLALVNDLREWVHLVGLGRQDPLVEFRNHITDAFRQLREQIETRIAETFATVEITPDGLNLDDAGLRGPSATWTYLINDRAMTELQQMLYGSLGMGGVALTWPLLAAWWLWRRWKKGKV
jgi:preprotein translocase subunit SecA